MANTESKAPKSSSKNAVSLPNEKITPANATKLDARASLERNGHFKDFGGDNHAGYVAAGPGSHGTYGAEVGYKNVDDKGVTRRAGIGFYIRCDWLEPSGIDPEMTKHIDIGG